MATSQQIPYNNQGAITVVSQPMHQAPVVVPMARRSMMNVSVIKGLGITQIVFGVIAIGLGIGATAGFQKDYWLTESGGGIWGGLWILTTGIIGVCSGVNPNISALNGTHMAFNVIATVVAFIDGIFFAVGVAFYNNCNHHKKYYHYYGNSPYRYSYYSYSYGRTTYAYRVNYNTYKDFYYSSDKYCAKDADAARAVYSLLMLIMVAEFFVALVASIYCCQATSCCRGTASQGVIVQQTQPQYIVSSSTGQTFMTPTYPQNPGMSTQYAPQSYPQPMVQQTPITGPALVGGNTNVAYSQGYKTSAPPAYVQ